MPVDPDRPKGYGHQLLTQTNDAGTATFRAYTRNPLGQITQAVSPEVTYTYTYDAAHRLASATDSRGGKGLNYVWSPGGLLQKTERLGSKTGVRS